MRLRLGARREPAGHHSLLDIKCLRPAGRPGRRLLRPGNPRMDMPEDPAGVVTNWVADIPSEHGEERVINIRSELQQSMDNNAAVFRTEDPQAGAHRHPRAQGALPNLGARQGKRYNSDPLEPSNWVSC